MADITNFDSQVEHLIRGTEAPTYMSYGDRRECNPMNPITEGAGVDLTYPQSAEAVTDANMAQAEMSKPAVNVDAIPLDVLMFSENKNLNPEKHELSGVIQYGRSNTGR